MIDKNLICTLAGVVLHLLCNTSGLTYNELKERSHFSDKELGMAIGWLAHENKVLFSSGLDDDKLYLNIYFYF